MVYSPFIFSFYFKAISPYIYYCLNDRNLKKEIRKINEISSVMKKQLLKLIDKYIEYLYLVISKQQPEG
jgi:hypothetical protein